MVAAEGLQPRLGLRGQLKLLDAAQRHVFTACLLGWALDAFDFFILVFAVKAIAEDFRAEVRAVTLAITFTLAMRPLGALLFGWAADRFGRHPTLMLNIVAYSVIELASAAAPSLPILIGLRALYGIAMGGEWGVGAALALESVPRESRGAVSGLLQQGYSLGYLLAALLFSFLFPLLGWRGMFVVGALPAGLVLYLRAKVPESPTWLRRQTAAAAAAPTGPHAGFRTAARRFLRLALRFLYLVLLMTCFNFFSHGTQDLYPTFLQAQRGFSSQTAGFIAVVYSVGALLGGMTFGAVSERLGRRRSIATAALLALPLIPVWVLGHGAPALAASAFGLQFMVQGAWGIVPAHINELSPSRLRGTFPGLAYQLGNLLASATATLQVTLAQANGNNYPLALGGMTAVVALVLAVVALLGPEAKGIAFDESA